MSDENSGAASSPEPTVPKARLDELIAERNQERQERMFLQQQVTELVRGQRQAQRPEVEDKELEDIKQSNPALYKRLKKQDQDARQLRAGFTSIADQNDRLGFILETGNEGKKQLQKVEEILHRERTQNKNFAVTRVGIFNWLKGQELVRRDQEQQAAPKKAAPVETSEVDAPSSDPRNATTIQGGTAPSKQVEKSREERYRELENVVF